MRKILVVAALAALVGCSSSSGGSSGSTGTSGGSGSTGGSGGTTGSESPTIAVSGTIVVHPVVSALQDAGLLDPSTPSLAGQTMFIDEPLIAITDGVQAGRLAQTTVDASGNFDAPQVPTDNILIGLVGTLASDSADGGFSECDVSSGAPAFCQGWARSVSLVWEDWVNNKPSGDISGVTAYAVPVSLSETLSASLGLAANQHLLDVGFVLGYVVDAQGNPVSGATLSDPQSKLHVEYLNDDLTSGGTATNKYGMFLIIAPGQPDPSHNYGISGHPEMKCHTVGSNPGTVLTLIWDASKPGVDCK